MTSPANSSDKARGILKKGVVSLLAFLATASAALCQENIGVAVTVKNDVTGKIQTRTVQVNAGSDVFGKEIVKTESDASAKIVLKDNTNLNVGPNSSVTLDKFVFAGPADYRQASFSMAKGAFRFTSGSSDKRAYDIKTPEVSIGVRGTDFAVVIGQGSTLVEVDHGKVIVCSRQGGGCRIVSGGQAVNASNRQVTPTQFSGIASHAACSGPCAVPLRYSEAVETASNAGASGASGAGGVTQLAGLAFGGAAVAGATAAGVVAGANQNNTAPLPILLPPPPPISNQ